MRKTDEKRRNKMGLSMTAAIVMIAAVSVLVTSSAVYIGVEESGIIDEKRDDCMYPYYQLTADPVHQNTTVNQNVTYEIGVSSNIYLYEPVHLNVLDMYDGVISSIEPKVIYPGDKAVLELTPMCEGEFFREIVGKSAHSTSRVRVTLSVGEEEEPSS